MTARLPRDDELTATTEFAATERPSSSIRRRAAPKGTSATPSRACREPRYAIVLR
jgi:hypothetical protein